MTKTISATRVIAGKPVGAHQIIEREPVPAVGEGMAAKIIRAIDRADARGLGCAPCKAVRKTARKMVTKLARSR